MRPLQQALATRGMGANVTSRFTGIGVWLAWSMPLRRLQ